MPVIPVILGPTASGKSALGVALARELDRRGLGPGEIVTADAFQVYRGLDVGTAKPTPEEQAGVPHHLVDVVDPRERFSVHDWLRGAEASVADVRGRGGVPIVVGGTNLYVKAFLEGLFQGPDPDEGLRGRLRALGQPARRAELERVDPAAAARIDPNDARRTIRALEVFRQTGTPISTLQRQWDRAASIRPGVRVVGLRWERAALAARINARVRAMIDAGLVDEARALWKSGQLGTQSAAALGYKQLIACFQGRCTLDEAIERIKIETRRFAKNQRTWMRRFRSIPDGIWIDAAGLEPGEMSQTIVNKLFTGDRHAAPREK